MASTPTSYKAYQYEAYGPAEEVVKMHTVTTKPLAPTDVRIKVIGAALNPLDHKLPEFLGAFVIPVAPSADRPFGIGFDVAGIVAEVGTQVDASSFKVGDEVYAMASFAAFGTIAEYIDLDADTVAYKPKSLDFNHAAGVPVTSLTSYQALFEHAKLEPGQPRVLVLGGSSATGIFAIQLAKSIGAYVITTASAKNEEFVKSIGADEVIDYRTQRWVDLVEHHSIDVVYDCSVEPQSWNDDAQSVLKKETGQFVTLGQVPDPVAAKFGATLHQMQVHASGQQLTAITRLFDSGKLKAIVDTVVSFDNVIDGFARVKSQRAVGKVIVQVASA